MTSAYSINIDENVAMDIEQLSSDGFLPLTSFLDYENLDSVLKTMRLKNGEIWPIPILFPKPAKEVHRGDELTLKFKNQIFAKLTITDSFSYDLLKISKFFFGTTNTDHPGVSKLKNSSTEFITGKLKKLKKLSSILNVESYSPTDSKKIIKKRNWKKIVGFHTRNPPHRAHEFLHKCSLENSDGLFIHPVIGSKKSGDFSSSAIMHSYKKYITHYLPKSNVILNPLLTYSRYAGPKEAVFTALIRKNYGCTHFIVGRDHTGVKNFYGKYDSQKIFKKLPDISLEILTYDEPYYCKKCSQITTSKTCPHGSKYYVEISGTIIRNSILNKSKLSEIYMRPEVIKYLKMKKNVFVK
ncbi:MAG: sulfate adenylyltransferase [Crenarchaeota archaeon]|nr:MAG: sulfate adenylyltransferase [Thermoproteota archaeon]RDJ33307.1 MAG: sulfate adenylyltransferase [Thermoproteota archaeon]RDJ36190.1 MAG: sulfate adenylyltransferase [Thermoproteota archaeon]RDJ38821.1 MAG: sulfate adenylyltransferase [Thermoproteota archaeon]